MLLWLRSHLSPGDVRSTACRFLLVSFAMISFVGNSCRGDESLQQLIGNVASNEAVFNNLEVIAEFDYQLRLKDNRFGAKAVRAARDTTRCVYQSDRFYLSNQHSGRSVAGESLDTATMAGFDGETTRLRTGQVANIRDGRIDPNELLRPHTMLLRRAWVGTISLAEYLAQTQNSRGTNCRTEIDGFERLGDLETVRLRIETWNDHQPRRDWRYLWLALERNYLPAKTVFFAAGYSDKIPLEEGIVTKFAEIEPGIWFPMQMEINVNDESAARKGETALSNTNSLVVQKADLHPEYGIELFRDIEFPPGSAVYEVTQDNQITNQYMAGSPERPDGQGRSWTPYIVLANVLVFSSMLGAFMVRNRKQRGAIGSPGPEPLQR